MSRIRRRNRRAGYLGARNVSKEHTFPLHIILHKVCPVLWRKSLRWLSHRQETVNTLIGSYLNWVLDPILNTFPTVVFCRGKQQLRFASKIVLVEWVMWCCMYTVYSTVDSIVEIALIHGTLPTLLCLLGILSTPASPGHLPVCQAQ